MPKKSNKKRADGRIAVQVYLGTVDGKRKYKTVYGTTQKEAEKKANEIRQQLKNGMDLLIEDSTFGYWVKRWLTYRESEATPVQYKDSVAKSRLFLNWNPSTQIFSDCEKDKRTLAHYDITKIKMEHLQDVLNALALNNPHTGKPTAKETLSKYRHVCKAIFDYAEYNRAIVFNPSKYLKVSQSAPVHKRRALTKEEQQRIIDTPHAAQTASMIMMFAGLRRGEVTALLWSDVDLKKNTISVTKSYDFNARTVKSPKTTAGTRIVPIPHILSKHLSSIPKTSLYVVSYKGDFVRESTWFSWLGSYLCDLNLKYGAFTHKRSKFAPVKQTFAIEPFTWHCLRHTYATILYDAGVDVLTAQKLLGHSDVKTTLTIYTHLSKEKEIADIDKLNQFLNVSQNVSQLN